MPSFLSFISADISLFSLVIPGAVSQGYDASISEDSKPSPPLRFISLRSLYQTDPFEVRAQCHL